MRVLITTAIALSLGLPALAQQTEASAGFDLQGTLSGMVAAYGDSSDPPGSGYSAESGIRLMLYPTWKLSSHWTVSGAFQLVTRQYYYSSFETQGQGVRGSIVQGSLRYAQVWNDASLQVRAGELPTAFGAFPLRYDDRDNALVDLPMQYGYYDSLATLGALTGAQADATWKKLDGRVQFTNSSPANPRNVFQDGQYANWAGGGGYTIQQGLRIGASGYRGPYLERESLFFRHGETSPRNLPGSGVGVEAEWGRGHWNVRGEWQRFVMAYKVIPTYHERAGYVEVQRTLGPRWYGAARFGDLVADYSGERDAVETVLGFRPGAGQIVKLSFETSREVKSGEIDRTVAVQFVTAIHPGVFARH